MYSKLTGNHKETDFAGKICEYLLLLRDLRVICWRKFPKEDPFLFLWLASPCWKRKEWCLLRPDWANLTTTCSRYGWFNQRYWYCFGLRRIRLTCSRLWSLYTNHHPSEEFPRTFLVSLALPTILLIIGIPHQKIMTLPIKLRKNFFRVSTWLPIVNFQMESHDDHIIWRIIR